MGFILIMFIHASAAPNSPLVPTYMGLYGSQQICEITAIETGAMIGDAKPKHLCVAQ